MPVPVPPAAGDSFVIQITVLVGMRCRCVPGESDMVFLAIGGTVYAYDGGSLALLWSRVFDSASYVNVVPAGDVVVMTQVWLTTSSAGTCQSVVTALAAATGAVMWTVPLPEPTQLSCEGITLTTPANRYTMGTSSGSRCLALIKRAHWTVHVEPTA